METPLQHAVVDAVKVVNSHAGETCVRLQFADEPEIDFIADSARMVDGAFEFQAGFETLAGSVDELTRIQTEVIQH